MLAVASPVSAAKAPKAAATPANTEAGDEAPKPADAEADKPDA
jgi:hypothetical protein